MNIKTIFVNPADKRLRAGWRLLLQTFFLAAIGLGISFLVLAAPWLRRLMGASLLTAQISELVFVTLSVWLARRWLDRRSFSSLGVNLSPRAGADMLTGVGITGLMMGLIYLLEWASGWLTFHQFAWQAEPVSAVLRNTLLMLLVFIFVGWNEELLSRGYHLQNLAEGLNMFWAVLLSSAVFGALHLGNPNATWVSVAGILSAGIFLAYGYLRTGQLWLSIGLHIGWNFFEGVVFGFPVSGLDIYPMARITVNGPELLTGGAFGPEAGLVLIPALALGSALIWWYTRGQRAETE